MQEVTAAPLISAMRATAPKRPRLPRNNRQSRRQNIIRPAGPAQDSHAPRATSESGSQGLQRPRRAPKQRGKRTKRGGAGEPNTLVQGLARSPRQERSQIVPPTSASINCSARKIPATRAFVAPIAFIMPTSARRSRTVAAEVAATASAAAISAASVTIQSSVLTCDRIFPSVSATWRIAWTSVPGKTCLI